MQLPAYFGVVGVFSVIFLSFFLLGSESWLYCDDVFGRGELFSVLHNGDPALIASAVHGNSDLLQDGAGAGGGRRDRTPAGPEVSASSEFHSRDIKAVVVMGTPSLPGSAVVTNTFKERLLRGLRVALLSGSLWLIVPCSGAEECDSVREFFGSLKPPASAIFPDAFLSELQPDLRELARRLRNSMMVEASFWGWLRSGQVIDRLAEFPGGRGEKAAVDVASPRLLRYGTAQWILPGLVIGEVEESELYREMRREERAVRLLLQRLFQVHLYDREEGAKSSPDTKPRFWLQNVCLNILVVSSMYNERYARAVVFNEMRRAWRALPVLSAYPWQPSRQHHQQQQELTFSECVHVLVTSADDAEPAWNFPSPLFVSEQTSSLFDVAPRASSLARFFGVYAHLIHTNYRRWCLCLRESVLSYRLLSFFYELGAIITAHLTEDFLVRDLVNTVLTTRNVKEEKLS